MNRLMQNDRTRKLLTAHARTYPELEIQDVLKFLHQSTFGCEHLVSSPEGAAAYIEQEHAQIFRSSIADQMIEPLDGDYVRISLLYMDFGLRAGTLAALFAASSKRETEGLQGLLSRLAIATELVREGILPFSLNEWECSMAQWAAENYPPVRHSEAFRAKYHPAYRVIAADYVSFLPLLAEIDQRLAGNKRLVIALEGGSASGKTTLSKWLEELYTCTVFHMDDFFLQAWQRTPERYAQIGGNIDWERFRSEILTPLRRGETIKYRKFDCAALALGKEENVIPGRLVIVEGAYSMHPELEQYYDFSVFLDISPKLQRERIRHRNTPQLAECFFNEWIPLEHVYFHETNAKGRCEMVVEVR